MHHAEDWLDELRRPSKRARVKHLPRRAQRAGAVARATGELTQREVWPGAASNRPSASSSAPRNRSL